MEQGDLVREDVYIVAVLGYGDAVLGEHVCCADGAETVDVDIAEGAFEGDHVGLAVFGSVLVGAGFMESQYGDLELGG